MKDTVYLLGERVRCVNARNMGLTEGKVYEVRGYQPKDVGPTYTWPPYVTVLGDFGEVVSGHASRFVKE